MSSSVSVAAKAAGMATPSAVAVAVPAVKGHVTSSTTLDYDEDMENLRQLLRLHNIAAQCANVRHIRCSAGSSSGDNYMSVVKRVQIGLPSEEPNSATTTTAPTSTSTTSTTTTTTNRKDSPVLSLIVKRQIPSLSRRQLFRCDEAFKNEISAYKQIVPLLAQYAPELCLPQCHFAGQDAYGEIIILEDLKAAGFRMQNRLKGLELNYCELVMKQLAKLHAASIVAKHLNAEVFREKCTHIHDIVYGPEAEDFYKNILDTSIQESLNSLRSSNVDGSLSEPIRAIERLQVKLFRSLQRSITGAKDNMSVLCHGDLWVNNIMFKELAKPQTGQCEFTTPNIVNKLNERTEELTANGSPCAVRFFDLQAMRYTLPVFDILHFIYTSTQRDLREAHTPFLLQTYGAALEDNLRGQFAQATATVPTPPPSITTATLNGLCETFSLANLTAEYYAHILYGLAISMWILPALTFDPNDIPNLDVLSEQNPTAKELTCTQMLTPEYHSRLRDLVLEFYEHGYLNEDQEEGGEDKGGREGGSNGVAMDARKAQL